MRTNRRLISPGTCLAGCSSRILSCPARASQNFANLEFSSSGRENPRTDALGPFDVESGLGLAIFFESAADIRECLVEMTWLAVFFEIGKLDQGEFFLRLRPHERHALAGPFLQGAPQSGRGLLQARRPALALAKGSKRIAQIGLRRGPIERHTIAGLFRKRPAVEGDRLFQLRRPVLTLSECSKRIAQIGLGRRPNERSTSAGLFRKCLPIRGDRLFQPRSPTLAFAKGSKRIAQIGL